MSIAVRRLAEADIISVLELIHEYVSWINLDLSFQHLREELDTFPAEYAEPAGAFFVAVEAGKEIVGCVGLRRLANDRCEMKRLFVRDAHRGKGAGRLLIQRVIDEAAGKDYHYMRLDTLGIMEAAQKLYAEFGFYEIAQYRDNPIQDARFMELRL